MVSSRRWVRMMSYWNTTEPSPSFSTNTSSIQRRILTVKKMKKVALSIFFLHLSYYFQKQTDSSISLTLSQTSPGFYVQYKPFENTVGKGEIAHNEQFLLFPQFFLPIWKTFCHFHQLQNCLLQTLSVWQSQKFVVRERVRSLLAKKGLSVSTRNKFRENNL